MPKTTFPARLATSLAGLAGWRRAIAAAAAGGLATLALPPAHVVPLLWVAFPLLLWLLRGARTGWPAFWTGWWFAFGHHVLGLYWISAALFVDIGRFWFALPFALGGLPALLAVFVGLATLAHVKLRDRFALSGAAEAALFAALWAGAEWVRGHIFTGFPWNLVGYAWADFLPVLQGAALVGTYGLSLLTVLVAGLPVALDGRGRARPWAPMAAGLAGLAVLGGWGAGHLSANPTRLVPGATLRLVQPGIEQELKWDPQARMDNFQKHLDMSRAPGWDQVTAVIWPETAVPFWLGNTRGLEEAISGVAPPGGVVITGVPRRGTGPDGAPSYANSMAVLDAKGVVATFDKFHLVPFGEYMPFRSILPVGAIASVAPSSADFSAGPGPRTLELPALPPVSPLICYEVIFPAAVAPDPAGPQPRPGWLLNLTNDAWYGETAGPHQHWAISRVRAVEEGLPLVRAANTGISGVVDPQGRVVGSLGLGEEGVLDLPLPMASTATPPYGRYGDRLFVLALLCVIMAVPFLARRV